MLKVFVLMIGSISPETGELLSNYPVEAYHSEAGCERAMKAEALDLVLNESGTITYSGDYQIEVDLPGIAQAISCEQVSYNLG